MNPLAYHTGIASWVAHAIARSLIGRIVWQATSGMSILEMLAVLAVVLACFAWVVER